MEIHVVSRKKVPSFEKYPAVIVPFLGNLSEARGVAEKIAEQTGYMVYITDPSLREEKEFNERHAC